MHIFLGKLGIFLRAMRVSNVEVLVVLVSSPKTMTKRNPHRFL